MTVSPRDDRNISKNLWRLVPNIKDFYFAGTYSITNSRIVQALRDKAYQERCMGIFLLPPPSDFFVWNQQTNLFREYGIERGRTFELFRAVAEIPEEGNEYEKVFELTINKFVEIKEKIYQKIHSHE